MIAPGTLVQHVGGGYAIRFGLLRLMGIYTVRSWIPSPDPFACPVCSSKGQRCATGGIKLVEVYAPPGVDIDGHRSVDAFTVCSFRILAPPVAVELQEKANA